MAESPTEQGLLIAARRTREFRCDPRFHLRNQGDSTVMAKSRLIANQRQTMRTSSIQIAFMQRELSLAVCTTIGALRTGRTTGGAIHNACMVTFGFLNIHHMSAMTAKPAASGPMAGIVLTTTLGTFNK
jgi:hypothetical protein